jgi:RsiW-degrading membrane proteinase PrsW (M82 family)
MAWFVTLFVVSTAPGFFILWFVYHSMGVGRREIPISVLVTFLAGCVVVLPAALIEGVAVPSVQRIVAGSVLQAFTIAFCVVAPIEETVKLLALVIVPRRKELISSPRDGVIYGVAAAMGFATVENLLFVMELGFSAGLFRALLSVPVHGICGAAVGHALGMSAERREKRILIISAGVGAALLFHGLFDSILLIEAG